MEGGEGGGLSDCTEKEKDAPSSSSLAWRRKVCCLGIVEGEESGWTRILEEESGSGVGRVVVEAGSG